MPSATSIAFLAVFAAGILSADAAASDGICQWSHLAESCGALNAVNCRSASTCEWHSTECALADSSATWRAAVGSANTDPGTVALRLKDNECNAAGLTQAACEADSSGWCHWFEPLEYPTEPSDRCTVKTDKFYTDLCRSSATYSPTTSSSRVPPLIAALVLATTATLLV